MKKARIVLIDDPTKYNNRRAVRKDGKQSRFGPGVDDRYTMRDNFGTMTVKDLIDLGEYIKMIATSDAYVFCWETMPNKPMALDIMKGRGLIYVTTPFVWVKTNRKSGTQFCGGGSYNFSNVEDVILGRYSNSRLWHPNNPLYKPRSVVVRHHPLDEFGVPIHSRKPEAIQDRLERWLYPYIDGYEMVELFATRERPRWHCLGGKLSGRDIREDILDLAKRME